MAKALKVLLFVFVPIGVVLWLGLAKLTEDPGMSLMMAFGHMKDDKITMELVVDIGMARRDTINKKGLAPIDWNQWVREHFILRDADGEEIPIQKIAQSGLIPLYKVAGAPEFYIRAILTQQAEYTLDYIPLKSEPKRYRRTIVAPEEKTEAKRQTFKIPQN